MKIHLPPLGERKEDIAALCRMFLRTISQDTALFIDDGEIGRLTGYDWPGNVRELKNVTERAVILRRGPAIQPSQFLEIPAFPRLGRPSVGESAIQSLAEAEKEHILGILQHCQGNHSKTALLLGISRSTLLRKLSQFAESAMSQNRSVS